jgi:hypothetical protein
LYQRLHENPIAKYEESILVLTAQQKQRNFWLMIIALAAVVSSAWFVLNF